MNREKYDFWNKRATLGAISGTYDTNLKQIEVRELCGRIPCRANVLDVGCGNGETLVELAKRNECTGLGLDFSENMVEEARKGAVEAGVQHLVSFEIGEATGIQISERDFDCAITERCLINLDSCEEQKEAVFGILDRVRPWGVYLMLEHSRQGLDEVNEFRAEFDLEPIVPPWHNLYMDDDVVDEWANELWSNRIADIVDVSYPGSVYYLISRVVYAAMLSGTDEAPDYDSVINQIAVKLPSFGKFGYSKLWVWRKL